MVDVRDPTRPTTVNYIAAPPGFGTCTSAHDDLLLVINARDLFADARFADEKVYYTRSVGDTVSDVQDRGWSAGLRIFDISTPAQPRKSVSCRLTASVFTASGTSAGAGRMCPR